MTTPQKTQRRLPSTEMGNLDADILAQVRDRHGRLITLAKPKLKSISDALGFTARFESPHVKSAYVDIFEDEGRITFEITRNTKPQDIGLRYMRERWEATEQSGAAERERKAKAESLLTRYTSSSLPKETLTQLIECLELKDVSFDSGSAAFVRVNFKEETAILIDDAAIDDAADDLQSESTKPPEAQESPTLLTPAESSKPDSKLNSSETAKEQKVNEQSATLTRRNGEDTDSLKYATYSRSEIDRLLKAQTENISNSLGSKITGHQKNLQDAIASQERALAKVVDTLTIQIEETKTKLEASSKGVQDSSKSSMDAFKSDLVKELDSFKQHLNKSILPNIKTIDDKLNQFEATIREANKPTPPDTKLLAISIAIGIMTLLNATMLYMVNDRLTRIESQRISAPR